MREFLMASCVPAIWTIAGVELVLLVFMILRFRKTKSKVLLWTACITAGLFYDALIIALGSVVNAGDMAVASRIRFISHGILIPLLFAICAEALNLKGAPKKIVYGLTIVLMVAGLAEAIATKLDVVSIAGLTRMASVKGVTPAWAEKISMILSFGTVIPLMIVGIVVIFKQKTPLLFLSGFFMFAFSALGPATKNSDFIFYISMYGEVLMVTFLMLYGLRKARKKA